MELADSEFVFGELRAAERSLDEAARLVRERLGPTSFPAWLLTLHRARLDFALGAPGSAVERLEASLPVLEQELGPNHPTLAEALELRAELHQALGDAPHAARDRERAAAMRQALAPRTPVCQGART